MSTKASVTRIVEHLEAMNRHRVPWFHLPNMAVTCRLEDRAQSLLVYLLSLPTDVHPSMEEIAASVRMRSSYVSKCIDELVARKVIAKDYALTHTRQKKVIMHLTDPRFWEIENWDNPYKEENLTVNIDPTKHTPEFFKYANRFNESIPAIQQVGEFTQVPRALAQTHDLTFKDKKIWCYLASCPVWKHPQLSELVYATGISKATVVKSLKTLEERRLIYPERFKDRSYGEAANVYHIPHPYFWIVSGFESVKKPEFSEFYSVFRLSDSGESASEEQQEEQKEPQVQSGGVSSPAPQVQSGGVQVQSGGVQVQSGGVPSSIGRGSKFNREGLKAPKAMVQKLPTPPETVLETKEETKKRDCMNETTPPHSVNLAVSSSSKIKTAAELTNKLRRSVEKPLSLDSANFEANFYSVVAAFIQPAFTYRNKRGQQVVLSAQGKDSYALLNLYSAELYDKYQSLEKLVEFGNWLADMRKNVGRTYLDDFKSLQQRWEQDGTKAVHDTTEQEAEEEASDSSFSIVAESPSRPSYDDLMQEYEQRNKNRHEAIKAMDLQEIMRPYFGKLPTKEVRWLEGKSTDEVLRTAVGKGYLESFNIVSREVESILESRGLSKLKKPIKHDIEIPF